MNKGADNIKKKTVILNDNKPILEKEDFNVIEGNPKYWGTDKYGRISGAIALLSKNTIPIITEKELEYPRPYGWNENLEKVKDVFESCHIIAYNLSAQNTTKENLFIGTNDLNTSIMKQIENEVNDYIQNNDCKVLYKVTVKYKGTDQIPLGILIEAQADSIFYMLNHSSLMNKIILYLLQYVVALQIHIILCQFHFVFYF